MRPILLLLFGPFPPRVFNETLKTAARCGSVPWTCYWRAPCGSPNEPIHISSSRSARATGMEAGGSRGGTMLGPPDTVVELRETEVSEEIFMDYLSSLGESTYRGDKYGLFVHNCNTFTNEVSQFLTGRTIPSYITDLPSEVLSTPFGQMLRPILDSIHIAPPGGNVINERRNV